ncbi:MAG: permease-like cell division protein FtsX [Aerococcaceae bacterium]|nr:permease-like cell division protein FtsX [Aerococcaceae bacterium]
MKLIRNFFRHIRDGFRNLFRNGLMTVASIFTMALTLFMVGSLIALFANVEKITTDVEDTIQVRAYIDLAANTQDEVLTQNKIKQIPHVTKITYRTKAEELKSIASTFGSEFEWTESTNPYHNVFVIDVDSTENLESVAKAVEELTYISNINYGGSDAQNLIQTIDLIRYVMAIIAAVFVVVAILLISNTIRLTIFARQTEIEIMRLVGATNRFIRAPFSLEGAFIGIIGAAIAFGLLLSAYIALQKAPEATLGLANLTLLPLYPLMPVIAVLLGVLGIGLGIFGARRSTKRFLKI